MTGINDGYRLVISGRTYNVRSCSEIPFSRSPAFERVCSVKASVYNKGTIVSGKRGTPELVGTIKVTPLVPAEDSLSLQGKTSGSLDLYRCLADHSVTSYYSLILEDVKEVNG